MANITRRTGARDDGGAVQPVPPRWDPFRMVRELIGWDPFQQMEMIPSWGDRGVFVPQFEVKETRDSYVFKADVPGIKDEDLDIALTGNRLTISGTRESEEKREDERFYAFERAYGSFSRSFTLPEGCDADHIRAELKEGVLTVVIPKRPEVQPKKIQIGGKTTKA